jgi:hypothetical protein
MSDSNDNPYAAPQAELSPSQSSSPRPATNFRRALIHEPLLFWPVWTLLYLANCILPFILGMDVVRKSNSGIVAMLLGIVTVYLPTSYLNYRDKKFRRYWLSGALIVGLMQFVPIVHFMAGALAVDLFGVSACQQSYIAYFVTIITGIELCLLALIIGGLLVAIYDAIFVKK